MNRKRKSREQLLLLEVGIKTTLGIILQNNIVDFERRFTAMHLYIHD